MTTIELNQYALEYNIAQYKKLIGDATLACVVKANAYGHGLEQIIELTKNNKAVAYYATATLTEALRIRALGAQQRILVMAYVDTDVTLALKDDIDLIVHNYHDIALYAAAAEQLQRRLNVHIKIDTGLARFGFLPSELAQLLDTLALYPLLRVCGLMSHCAQADVRDQSYTYAQMLQFNDCIDVLHARGMRDMHIHMHATSAVLKHGLQRTNMVRIGAGLYGMDPLTATDHGFAMHQVLTLKSSIIALRTVPKGAYIGYGSTFCAPRSMCVAIVATGYADGYPRRASNVAKAYVANRYVPVIGRVAMNTLTLDVTDVDEILVGSEVVLLGDLPELRLHEFARAIGSFNPREISVGLSTTLSRYVIAKNAYEIEQKQYKDPATRCILKEMVY